MKLEVSERVRESSRSIPYQTDPSAIFSIYNGMSILVLGNKMENVFRKLTEKVKSGELNTRTGIYFVRDVQTNSFSSRGPIRGYMSTSKNDLYRESEMITLLNEDGTEMDEEIEEIKNPDVKIMALEDIVSDSDFRKGAELVAGLVDRTCATIIVSDFDDDFARKIHASLVTKIPVTREATASFVIRNRDISKSNVEAITLINSIKARMDNFMVIEKKSLMTRIPVMENAREELEVKIIKNVVDFMDQVPSLV